MIELQLTVPVPANPVKLAKLAAARAAKETKGKPAGSAMIDIGGPGSSMASLGLTQALQQQQKQQSTAAEGSKDSAAAPRWYMGEYDTAKGTRSPNILNYFIFACNLC
jgi:hypothetical protein